MRAKCKNNIGAENQLTLNKFYDVLYKTEDIYEIELPHYMIIDDLGMKTEYNTDRFIEFGVFVVDTKNNYGAKVESLEN
jgi:hypothetical protein